MRLTHRNRDQERAAEVRRIAITQAEITVDLHYPGARQAAATEAAERRAGQRGR